MWNLRWSTTSVRGVMTMRRYLASTVASAVLKGASLATKVSGREGCKDESGKISER